MKLYRNYLLAMMIFFACCLSLASETSIDYASIIKTTIDWGAHGTLSHEKDAEQCLTLDIAALICDIFLSVGSNVDAEKFQVISDTMYSINPTVYSRVKELRFDPIGTSLQWHPYADMTVAQFKDIAFIYFQARLEIDKITSSIKAANNIDIPRIIVTSIRSIANKDLFIDMINLWKTASLGIPTDPKKAEVTCLIQ